MTFLLDIIVHYDISFLVIEKLVVMYQLKTGVIDHSVYNCIENEKVISLYYSYCQK